MSCKNIDTETVNDYKQLVEELTAQGFFQGVTIDGKRGVAKAFSDISVQMCHFHQVAIIKRYLISRSKLEASIEPLDMQMLYPSGTIDIKLFLTKKLSILLLLTHAKLVGAYRSLSANLPYLFTYKNHKEFKIPDTTNALNGGVFSQLKKLIQLHHGLAKKRKVKLIDEFLDNYNKQLFFSKQIFHYAKKVYYKQSLKGLFVAICYSPFIKTVWG